MLTLKQMLTLAGLTAPPLSERAAFLGLVLPMLVEPPGVASRSLRWHYARLNRAIELDQVKLYFDRFGRCCGYVWWTKAPAELESGLLRHGSNALEASELSTEGDAWILDFRASLGELPNILMDVRDTLSSQCNTLTYFRYKGDRRIAKRITLDSKASFFYRASQVADCGETAWLRSGKGKSSLSAATAVLQQSITLGLILELFAQLPSQAGMPLPAAFSRILDALKTRQCKLLRASNGELQGFYSWAWREVEELSPSKLLNKWEAYEWRDGRDALVCDAIAMRSGVEALRQELSTFAEGDWLFYLKAGSDETRRFIPRHEWLSLPVTEADIHDFTALTAMQKEGLVCEI